MRKVICAVAAVWLAAGGAIGLRETVAQSSQFQERAIAPFAWTEIKLSGEKIVHHGYQAMLDAHPDSTEIEMTSYAEQVFGDKLRPLLDLDAKNNIAFVTFVLSSRSFLIVQTSKTFRVVFIRENGVWRNVKNKT